MELKKTFKGIALILCLIVVSAIIPVDKCCPFGEVLDQLGGCLRVGVDRFNQEVTQMVQNGDLVSMKWKAIEGKTMEGMRCQEVAQEFMVRVDGVLLNDKDGKMSPLLLEIWDDGYQQTGDFACLDKLEREEGLVALLCHSDEKKMFLIAMIYINQELQRRFLSYSSVWQE